MKRFRIVLALVMALTLAGCSENNNVGAGGSISTSSSDSSNSTGSANSENSESKETSNSSETPDSTSLPAESDDPLYVADEPRRRLFEPTGTDAEIDEIVGLCKDYAVFYFNYFLEADWIKVDNNDRSEEFENCCRATNVTPEQFFGKLKAYATDRLADELLTRFEYVEYVVENDKLYTFCPLLAFGWGIPEVKLTMDSVEYPNDTTIKVNFTSHNEDPETHEPMEDDKITVILKRMSEGLRVDECDSDGCIDLCNYREIDIEGKTYPF